MSLPSTMFPGLYNGSNLLANGHIPLPSSNSTNSNSSMANNSSSSLLAPGVGVACTTPTCFNTRLMNAVPSAAAVTASSTGLFPPFPPPSTTTDFPLPIWQNPFMPFFPPLSTSMIPGAGGSNAKIGGISIGNPMDLMNSWLNSSNPTVSRAVFPPANWLPRPPIGPAAYHPPCTIPKSGSHTNLIEQPSKKRNCNSSARQSSSSSPYCCPAITTAPAITGTTIGSSSCNNSSSLERGKCCPICSQLLSPNSSPSELNRHFIQDANETEELFLRLKRKLTAISDPATAAAAWPTATSPDPAVKSRMETFHRIRENRVMRMRGKLANDPFSTRNNMSSAERKLFIANESMAHASIAIDESVVDDDGEATDLRRSTTSNGSDRDSTASSRSVIGSRSASRRTVQSPGTTTDDAAKTPMSDSVCSLSPTTMIQPTVRSTTNSVQQQQQQCKLCSTNNSCQDNPVCPNCSTSNREDISSDSA